MPGFEGLNFKFIFVNAGSYLTDTSLWGFFNNIVSNIASIVGKWQCYLILRRFFTCIALLFLSRKLFSLENKTK